MAYSVFQKFFLRFVSPFFHFVLMCHYIDWYLIFFLGWGGSWKSTTTIRTEDYFFPPQNKRVTTVRSFPFLYDKEVFFSFPPSPPLLSFPVLSLLVLYSSSTHHLPLPPPSCTTYFFAYSQICFYSWIIQLMNNAVSQPHLRPFPFQVERTNEKEKKYGRE